MYVYEYSLPASLLVNIQGSSESTLMVTHFGFALGSAGHLAAGPMYITGLKGACTDSFQFIHHSGPTPIPSNSFTTVGQLPSPLDVGACNASVVTISFYK